MDAGVHPRGLAVGDVTGDSLSDLVVLNFGAPTFIGNDTTQTLLSPETCKLQLFSPGSTGLIFRGSIQTDFSPRGAALANLDGKGGSEVLVTCYDAGKLQIFTWGQGGFTQWTETSGLAKPVGVAVSSFKAGGSLVVAVANYSTSKVSLFAVDSDGKTSNRVDVPVAGGPTKLAFGDVNGDGVKEIVVICITGQKIDILSLPADAAVSDLSKVSVTSSLTLPENSGPADLDVVDLNHDGRIDVAVCNFSANNLTVYYQNTSGVLVAEPLVATGGSHPNGMKAGDLDGDGIMECVVADRDSDLVDVFKADAAGHYVLQDSIAVASDSDKNMGPVEPGILDVNGDGALDLVTTHMRSKSLRVLIQDVPLPTPTPVAVIEAFSNENTKIFPNPSKGKAVIRFSLAQPGEVTLKIFDLTGQAIWSTALSASQTRGGFNEVLWNAVNQAQAPVASGLYVVEIAAEGNKVTRKVAIIR